MDKQTSWIAQSRWSKLNGEVSEIAMHERKIEQLPAVVVYLTSRKNGLFRNLCFLDKPKTAVATISSIDNYSNREWSKILNREEDDLEVTADLASTSECLTPAVLSPIQTKKNTSKSPGSKRKSESCEFEDRVIDSLIDQRDTLKDESYRGGSPNTGYLRKSYELVVRQLSAYKKGSKLIIIITLNLLRNHQSTII
ncbi:hypothetical protein RN001_005570 [Aquatica leii]|uniref:Uncharacterized protein n=1 Tax=Aquatica leii TaxID=1421715 RepID=A0AAN7PH78_9COLE|nr:hypothetical protein RN001_005570 [Aquatica leii]